MINYSVNHLITQVHTWSSDIHIHAVILDLSLRRGRSDGGNTQVSCIQMLLCPFPVVSVISQIQHGLLLKLKDNTNHHNVSIGSTRGNG